MHFPIQMFIKQSLNYIVFFRIAFGSTNEKRQQQQMNVTNISIES